MKKKIIILFTVITVVMIHKQSFSQNITINPDGITPTQKNENLKLNFQEILNLSNPQKGDTVYDLTFNCLRIYSGEKWLCSYQNPSDITPPIAALTKIGGFYYDEARGIVADNIGNIYITGYFSVEALFGSTNLSSNGSSDIFLAKYNNLGILQWVKKAGGSSEDQGLGISIDLIGNIYITGSFKENATFDNTSISSTGECDIFVAKYNSNGGLQWVKKAGSISNDWGYAITTDNDSNVYITGGFNGNAIFANNSITATGNTDIFIAKLNSAGDFQWAKKAGGNYYESALDIAISGNNVYITGYFEESVAFENTMLNSYGSKDIFIANYNLNGNLIWVQKAGSYDYDEGTSIDTDNLGNIYVAGHFKNSASFGTTTVNSLGSSDIFLAKINSSGNLLWIKTTGDSDHEEIRDINVDNNNNIYVTGQLRGKSKIGNFNINSLGGSDIFIAKYNSSGEIIWVQKAGGPNDDISYGVSVDINGNIYLAGYFNGSINFGFTNLSSPGRMAEIFIARVNE